MSAAILKITFSVEDEINNCFEAGIDEEVQIEFISDKQQWRVSSPKENSSVFWIGYSESRNEAILEYLNARLGNGRVQQQLVAYDNKHISLEDLAKALDLDLEVLVKAKWKEGGNFENIYSPKYLSSMRRL